MLVELQAKSNLFAGVDEVINRELGVESYRHKSACLTLLNGSSFDVSGERLVSEMFNQLQDNWETIAKSSDRLPSAENFRWFEPKIAIADANKSPEVTLERALIKACLQQGRTDWSNQVPIASGLVNATAYKRRAIDLVRRRGRHSFDLVELKVASDTPLYAAMEILLYGMLWLLSRIDRNRLGYANKPIIEADSIDFRVLAPRRYYEGVDVRPFARQLDRGVASLGRNRDVDLGFSFKAFSDEFVWPNKYSASALSNALDRIEAV